MKYVVVDFEMNPILRSYKNERAICKNEIIQIGAVLLDDNYKEQDSFQMYVKPVFSEKLKRSIVDLTGITDEKLLSAPRFEKAMKAFFEWCLHCEDKVQVIQWSENDYLQVIDEISLKKYIPTDQEKELLSGWHDFQKEYGDVIGRENQTSLSYAVMLAGEEFEGKRHDALYDARNTARILRTVRIPEERKRSLGKVIEVLKEEKTLGTTLGDMFDFSMICAVA